MYDVLASYSTGRIRSKQKLILAKMPQDAKMPICQPDRHQLLNPVPSCVCFAVSLPLDITSLVVSDASTAEKAQRTRHRDGLEQA